MFSPSFRSHFVEAYDILCKFLHRKKKRTHSNIKILEAKEHCDLSFVSLIFVFCAFTTLGAPTSFEERTHAEAVMAETKILCSANDDCDNIREKKKRKICVATMISKYVPFNTLICMRIHEYDTWIFEASVQCQGIWLWLKHTRAADEENHSLINNSVFFLSWASIFFTSFRHSFS